MNKCENCDKEHDGEYGSGRFCSSICARGFSTKNKRIEINKKVALKLTIRNEHRIYVCEKCDNEFNCEYVRKGTKVHCDDCKRNVVHAWLQPKSLFELSSRTRTKILQRANVKCAMCDWDKTTLDIHHIIYKKNGGTDNNDNLICLCPNCHRLAHEKKYTINELQANSIDIFLTDWIKYYHPSN